jgi:hypothetical protein
MSEAASFGNIVSSLLTVRQNYHEQLKTIPQYEAYLLVESSTEKAAAALQSIASSPASIAAEVIDSLQFARTRFEQHLIGIPEYRALVAIDKLIKDVSVDLGGSNGANETAKETAPETGKESMPETPAAALPAAELEVAAPVAEPDPVPEHAETAELSDVPEEPSAKTALPLVDVPLRSTPIADVDIDAAPIDDDDIISVHMPSSRAEDDAQEQEDLLAIARGVAELSKSAAIEAANAAAMTDPYSLVPPQPKLTDHDDADEAAA